MIDISNSMREFIHEHRVARLATADRSGQPTVIPICYAFDGVTIYSPLDEKPKSVAPARLKRVRNIETNARVSLVIDDYSDDWSKLAYVLITGQAEIIRPGEDEHSRAVVLLREKYPQYRAMAIDKQSIIKITPVRIKQWGLTFADAGC